MSDWGAVAKAIDERVRELGWPQGELADRSGVARSTVREIQHHLKERRRNASTLESLSSALGWPRDRIAYIAERGPSPDAARTLPEPTSEIGELRTILEEIVGRLDVLQADVRTLRDRRDG